MRGFLLALGCLAGVLITACADRGSVAAHQMPQPYPSGIVRADGASAYYRQTALGSVLGTSEYSWFLPEPNRQVFRQRFQRALQLSGLAAPNPDHARYLVHFDFTQVEGPVAGSHMEAALIGTMRVEDRLNGATVLSEPISARREAYWPGVMESDWADGGVLDALNVLPFFFDSPWLSVGPRWDTTYPAFSGPEWMPHIPIRMRPTDGRLVHGENGRVYGARSGAARAWQVNTAVSDALAAAFLTRMAEEGAVDIARVMPCWGGAAVRREKLNMLRRGERYVTLPCDGQFHDVPMGAEALVGL